MMKILVLSIAFLSLMSAKTTYGAGPYEVGRVSVEETTCVWTSNIKRDCTADLMRKNVRKFEACYEPNLEKEASKCQDEACVRNAIKKIVSSCCTKLGGAVQ